MVDFQSENLIKLDESFEESIGVLIMRNHYNIVSQLLVKCKDFGYNLEKQFDIYLRIAIENDSFDIVHLLK